MYARQLLYVIQVHTLDFHLTCLIRAIPTAVPSEGVAGLPPKHPSSNNYQLLKRCCVKSDCCCTLSIREVRALDDSSSCMLSWVVV